MGEGNQFAPGDPQTEGFPEDIVIRMQGIEPIAINNRVVQLVQIGFATNVANQPQIQLEDFRLQVKKQPGQRPGERVTETVPEDFSFGLDGGTTVLHTIHLQKCAGRETVSSNRICSGFRRGEQQSIIHLAALHLKKIIHICQHAMFVGCQICQ